MSAYAGDFEGRKGGVYEGGNVRMFECEKVVLELEA